MAFKYGKNERMRCDGWPAGEWVNAEEYQKRGEPCVWCMKPTNPGHKDYTIGYFVNRTWTQGDVKLEGGGQDVGVNGSTCGRCGGFLCDRCEKSIYIDCEVRVDGGVNLHEGCAKEMLEKGELEPDDVLWGYDFGEEE